MRDFWSPTGALDRLLKEQVIHHAGHRLTDREIAGLVEAIALSLLPQGEPHKSRKTLIDETGALATATFEGVSPDNPRQVVYELLPHGESRRVYSTATPPPPPKRRAVKFDG